jgi:diguanylate cyclase (GGDEF)-like protein/PAS domain S-box-containing protein
MGRRIPKVHSDEVQRADKPSAGQRRIPEKTIFRSVFENAGIGMMLANMDQKLLQTNAAFARMLGYSNDELRGRRLAEVMHPDDLAEVQRLYRALESGEIERCQSDLRYLRKDGSVMSGRMTASSVPQDGLTPHFTVAMIEDITERKRAEARIEYLATHDGLTGLPNRSLFRDRMMQAVAHVRRAGRLLAIVFLDLDRFKVINDGFGHGFGDAVLKAAAERLTGVVRDGDTVARQSGDEFLILLDDVRRMADIYVVVQKLLDAFARPLLLQEREVFLTASIGISVYPDDGQSADALIANADTAMYRAKKLGGNAYQFFTRQLSDETRHRVDLETELRGAVARDQLQLAYQPKVEIASGRIIGCEALLRWSHPRLGCVAPADFIPIAEECGQILPIGDWVLRSACERSRQWLDAGLPPVVVSVNISARQFHQQDLAGWVLGTLEHAQLPPERLELELTESLIAQDVDQAMAGIKRLKAAGVKLSIDDFGTGFSNLGTLKRFRVDTLKIDQSFVRDILTDADDATIALATIALAHNLRMRVIAEGVETAEQCVFLRDHRCDEIQGYFFSKPVSASDMTAMLAADRRLAAV